MQQLLSSYSIQPPPPSIIHKAQVGFVPGREARDNSTKTINHISYVQKYGLKACLLSFDAEKAFDWVNGKFLQMSLEQVGLSIAFVTKVMSLYSQPSTSVLVNGSLLDLLLISNVTQQGCPLSLLFVIVNTQPKPYVKTIRLLASRLRPYTISSHFYEPTSPSNGPIRVSLS